MALEFSPIAGLDLYRLMKLQEVWEADYPKVSDVPGLPPTSVGDASQGVMIFGEPPKRLWATAATNGLLVQTQADRLILNWRKSEADGPYPGYEKYLRPEFFRLWGLMGQFVEKYAFPFPIPTLAEFTYVNSVALEDGERAQDILTILRDSENPLPGSESQTRFQMARAITASESDPFTAQLHVIGETQVQPDGRRRLQFTVTARVLLDAVQDDPGKAIEAAHGLASYTFASIVTLSKQTAWNRLPR